MGAVHPPVEAKKRLSWGDFTRPWDGPDGPFDCPSGTPAQRLSSARTRPDLAQVVGEVEDLAPRGTPGAVGEAVRELRSGSRIAGGSRNVAQSGRGQGFDRPPAVVGRSTFSHSPASQPPAPAVEGPVVGLGTHLNLRRPSGERRGRVRRRLPATESAPAVRCPVSQAIEGRPGWISKGRVRRRHRRRLRWRLAEPPDHGARPSWARPGSAGAPPERDGGASRNPLRCSLRALESPARGGISRARSIDASAACGLQVAS